MNAEHQREHELIAEAIEMGWLDYASLLVHLAGSHGLTVADLDNSGTYHLQRMHDAAHGVPRRSVQDELEEAQS